MCNTRMCHTRSSIISEFGVLTQSSHTVFLSACLRRRRRTGSRDEDNKDYEEDQQDHEYLHDKPAIGGDAVQVFEQLSLR